LRIANVMATIVILDRRGLRWPSDEVICVWLVIVTSSVLFTLTELKIEMGDKERDHDLYMFLGSD
jgi:hypothetical protein